MFFYRAIELFLRQSIIWRRITVVAVLDKLLSKKTKKKTKFKQTILSPAEAICSLNSRINDGDPRIYTTIC